MEIKKGRYRHYKGNEYEVLFVAKHSETMEDMVIYRSTADAEKIWARPKSMWNEMVEMGDGQKVKRFTFVDK